MPAKSSTAKDDTEYLDPTDVDLGNIDIDLDASDDDDLPEIPPARVRIGGRAFEVEAPDAGLVMEIEEANTTARVLQLLFDKQWPDVRPLLEAKKPEQLVMLVNELGDKFGFSQRAMIERSAPNRAERRRRRSGGRR